MTDSQPSLFRPTLDDRFREYHVKNPQVYQFFERFALVALNSGMQTFGAKAIMERVRWEVSLMTKDHTTFKINNYYTSRYARLLVEQRPEFAGFFEMRRLWT